MFSMFSLVSRLHLQIDLVLSSDLQAVKQINPIESKRDRPVTDVIFWSEKITSQNKQTFVLNYISVSISWDKLSFAEEF